MMDHLYDYLLPLTAILGVILIARVIYATATAPRVQSPCRHCGCGRVSQFCSRCGREQLDARTQTNSTGPAPSAAKHWPPFYMPMKPDFQVEARRSNNGPAPTAAKPMSSPAPPPERGGPR
jgi:hypothetical protein